MQRIARLAASVALTVLCAMTAPTCSKSAATPTVSREAGSHTSADAVAVLRWLPPDTETLIVANGPFELSAPSNVAEDESDHAISARELMKTFASLQIGVVTLPADLVKRLSAFKVLFAAEGSRHFRAPTSLGEMLFEGCEIVRFDVSVRDAADAYLASAPKTGTQFEKIEGQPVAVFRTKLEADVWITFVAFPKPDLMVIATNRDYLREVLSRIGGHDGPRALPADLLEWKYVDWASPIWALRHYDRSQALHDPSNPFSGGSATTFTDTGTIGIVFNLRRDQTATITYLSSSKDASNIFRTRFFPPGSEATATKSLNIEYRDVASGVIEGRFTLKRSEAVSYFEFMLMAAFGHGVFV
jgi:hypothetical protein